MGGFLRTGAREQLLLAWPLFAFLRGSLSETYEEEIPMEEREQGRNEKGKKRERVRGVSPVPRSSSEEEEEEEEAELFALKCCGN